MKEALFIRDTRRLLGGLVHTPVLRCLAVNGCAALAVDEPVEAHAASGLDEEQPRNGANKAALDDLVDALLLLLAQLVVPLHVVAEADMWLLKTLRHRSHS